jgi:hypothetical protein
VAQIGLAVCRVVRAAFPAILIDAIKLIVLYAVRGAYSWGGGGTSFRRIVLRWWRRRWG